MADTARAPRVIKIEDEVDFPCPFCTRECTTGEVKQNGLTYSIVKHTMPTCKKFNDLNPDQFLTACLKEMKKTAPN